MRRDPEYSRMLEIILAILWFLMFALFVACSRPEVRVYEGSSGLIAIDTLGPCRKCVECFENL